MLFSRYLVGIFIGKKCLRQCHVKAIHDVLLTVHARTLKIMYLTDEGTKYLHQIVGKKNIHV